MRTSKTTWLLAAGLVVAGAGAALWTGSSEPSPATTPDPVAAAEMPADHPSTATKANNSGGLGGTVQEVIQVDSYSYLRLDTGQGDAWAAVPKTEVAKGDRVNVVNPMLMTDFESKSLGRRFDKIYFGSLGSGAAQAGMPADHPPMGATANPHGAAAGEQKGEPHQTPGALVVEGVIPKPDGGLTVAEAYAKAADQEGKTVKIAGRITKVTPAVLGKTWLHVQDGSGDPDKGTHDLVVTTQEVPALGDTVVLTGTLVRDKDLGGGYRYDVLLEDANVEAIN